MSNKHLRDHSGHMHPCHLQNNRYMFLCWPQWPYLYVHGFPGRRGGWPSCLMMMVVVDVVVLVRLCVFSSRDLRYVRESSTYTYSLVVSVRSKLFNKKRCDIEGSFEKALNKKGLEGMGALVSRAGKGVVSGWIQIRMDGKKQATYSGSQEDIRMTDHWSLYPNIKINIL